MTIYLDTSDPRVADIQRAAGLPVDGEATREFFDWALGAIRELPAEECYTDVGAMGLLPALYDGGRLDEIPDRLADILIEHAGMCYADSLGSRVTLDAFDPATSASAKPVKPVLSAWLGWTSRKSFGAELQRMADGGFTRAELMANAEDGSGKRTSLGIYDEKYLLDVAQACRDLGLELGLTLWLLRNREYLAAMAVEAGRLAAKLGAVDGCFDAEGGYLLKGRGDVQGDAAFFLGRLTSPVPWRASSYALAPSSVLGPLMRGLAGGYPQPYVTKNSYTKTYTPTSAPGRAYRHYKDMGAKDVRIALAAYRQSGIPGYTPEGAIEAATRAAVATGTTHIAYWWAPTLSQRLIDGIQAAFV